ncbi:MAG: beta-N-acetylhexosaminidase, partial [Legionella longbeachae]|nr:beta-N-acetylhexosaminidase [Legionella longbeachae]
VCKHFPGHGSVISDSHITMPISHRAYDALKCKDLKPFIELINKDLLNAIMPAHVTYKAVDAKKPAGFSTTWLQKILRNELGFKGLVLSDCLSMTGADIGNLMTRTEEALSAGCDMLIVCHQPRTVLLELLQTITFKQLPESAARIISFKNQMLRFADPEKKQLPASVYNSLQEHQELSASNTPNAQFNTTQTI